eukprot:scaffold304_cov409-Prasinococcus_capsulatus_cf.AAC.18
MACGCGGARPRRSGRRVPCTRAAVVDGGRSARARAGIGRPFLLPAAASALGRAPIEPAGGVGAVRQLAVICVACAPSCHQIQSAWRCVTSEVRL